MLHFDMQNQIAVVDATNVILIPELGRLYTKLNLALRDKVFTYIHVVAQIDTKAPFFSADPEEIRDLALRNYFNEEVPFPDRYANPIENALTAYIKAYETPEVRMVKIFNEKIDQLRKLIKDTTPEIVKVTNPNTGVVSFSSNVDILTKTMEKIDSLMATKERLEAKIRRESEGKGSFRGNKKPSRLEREAMKDKK